MLTIINLDGLPIDIQGYRRLQIWLLLVDVLSVNILFTWLRGVTIITIYFIIYELFLADIIVIFVFVAA